MEDVHYKLIIREKEYYEDVYSLLQTTNDDFTPALTEKFSLEEITDKYIKLAHIYIAYVRDEPAGLVAFYPNEFPKDSYMSLIAVKSEFRGFQIGKSLETKCINYCQQFGSKGLLLNMRRSNSKLFESRQKLGYKVVKEYTLEYSAELIVDMHIEF